MSKNEQKADLLPSASLVQNGMLSPAVPIDGDGRVLHEGDRVYSYGYDDNWKPKRLYGTLHKNEDFPEVSKWYIAYDDGQECAVLEMSLVFKA